jgi:hypothetical protein
MKFAVRLIGTLDADSPADAARKIAHDWTLIAAANDGDDEAVEESADDQIWDEVDIDLRPIE